MGVVKNKGKTKSDPKKDQKNKKDEKNKKDQKNKKDMKKKKVSCLQCFKSPDDGGLEGKYRVAAPELMQDTFMSDSEDEGGEVECPIQQQQQYRYMNSEAGTLNRARPLEDSVTDGHLWPSNNDKRVATMERQPLDIGFLVSFVVDARGGAMKAKRRGGVRVIVPPAACAAPTRVTCRAATRRAPVAAPPPLMEGEALASRLLELQPQGAKFLAPVIIEVPIFTASCPEREIVILRSDTGETWQDHYLHNNDNQMIQEALNREKQEHGPGGERLGENGERVTRIITCDFPHYLAVVSRVRQEVHVIGPEGGTVSSAHIPQVQALFPPAALTKRIRVGLQAHGANRGLCSRLLPRHAAVSPVLTVEPRRRKFHRTITLTAPLPQPHDQKLNSHDKQSTANLRLLCSIMGGQARAVWEDVTGSTPLTITDDCASFTTTVSARFWLMNCQNVSDATKLATDLYREMLLVPFEIRIVVLGKRLDSLEGRLLVLYITDRYAYDTLLHQEHYTEVAHSTSVRLLDGRPVYLEFSGNLVPVTKSGTQPTLVFEAFKDNRVEFPVRVKHHEETPSGRIYFMNEPKVAKGEPSVSPTCVLDVALPERVAPRPAKSHLDCLNLDQSGFDALKDELSFHWGDHNHGVGPPPIPTDQPTTQLNGHDKSVANGDVKYQTKDDQIKDTPHVNGDTTHDTNKIKATFDSDEDKTPMNTLDKGKKKSEGVSFLGGLADKVKNVFSHSEDKEDSKESSPKPQPKPRESKEKSPPKPAPRIINEDLLEKVEDMFKDVRTKPHLKDEDDINSQVYSTKLIVEENPDDLRLKTEEVYHQYENMQPVDTPLYSRKSDPFQFFTGCCEEKYKKGEKHRHDETSNLSDRIEQVRFSTHEQIQEIEDQYQNDLQKGLKEANKEKDNIKQELSEVKEDIIVKSENIKNNLIDREEKLKSDFEVKVQEVNDVLNNKENDLSASGEKIKSDIGAKVVDVQTKLSSDLDSAKSAANDAINNLFDNVDSTKQNINNKYHELDLAAMERAEEIKLRGHDKLSQMGKTFENTADDINNKTQEAVNDAENKLSNLKTEIESNAENVKDKVKEKSNNVKQNINDNVSVIKAEAVNIVDDVEEKSKKAVAEVKSKGKDKKNAAKKKAKEGKNFFTGLVHNIFGEKEKIEDEVKGKFAEGKESVNKLSEQALAAKDKLEENVAEEEHKLKQQGDQILQSTENKAKDIAKNVKDAKDDLVQSVQEKTEQAVNGLQEQKHQVLESAQDKTNEIVTSVKEKKDGILQSAEEKKNEVLQSAQDTTEQVVASVEAKKDEFLQKKNDLIQNAEDKKNELLQNAQDKGEELFATMEAKKNEAVQKKDELFQSAEDKKNEVLNITQDKTEQVMSAMEGKKNEALQNIENKSSQVVQNVEAKREEIAAGISDNIDKAKQSVVETKDNLVLGMAAKRDEAVNFKNTLQDDAENRLNQIRQEAEETTDEIKRTAEETLNAAAEKKTELKSNIASKFGDLKDTGMDELEIIENAAKDKSDKLQKSAKVTFENVEESASSAFDKIESAATDKVSDVKDIYDDLQSSTRDTFADLKDDLQGYESSAQDTLHSFQSSAGNTFDSLDESAKEFIVDVQSSASKSEESANKLFGNVKDSFEGFQIAAGDKLEDIKVSTKRLEDGDDLESAKDNLMEGLKESEQAVTDTVSNEADKFTSSLNDLGNSVFGMSGKGFMKDSSTKLLESEKSQSSPHKKSSGIPKLKRKK